MLMKKTDALIKKTFGPNTQEVEREKFTLADVIKFNTVLKSYQITVYDDVHLHKKVLFRRYGRRVGPYLSVLLYNDD